ncbi:MAG: hypothetical protein ER33_14210 [Cyanobium sp. CACIAM 14]|nr:MAG: hypothetical protein ER33_14210 [Cyanobium sp. CACIAM 14]
MGADRSARISTAEKETAGLLWVVGLVIIGYGLILLVFGFLPLGLLDPAWQLRASAALTGAGPYLLIGSLLACMARAFNRANQALVARVKLLRRISLWAAIVYLLFIPIQLQAGVQLLRQKSAREAQTLSEWQKFRARLRATSTEDDLRTLLAGMKQPITLPAKLDIPVATLKGRILADTDSRFSAFRFQAAQDRAARWQNFLAEATSNVLKTLLMLTGFAALAQLRPGQPSILQKGLILIRRKRSRGSASA